MALVPGLVINNRYRIVKLISQGGFGAVYRAWDLNLMRPCAIKENLDTSPEAQKQFFREAQILANLSHSNLARVTDHFTLPGQGQYLVMDYVEGQDLQEILDRLNHPLLEAQALDWIAQVCEALIYLHGQNPPVIHRDIKPANIKITSEGKAVLVDFGIAKIYDSALKTTMGARAVTPGYSPPEQYGHTSTDARSDIYALGATLYTLLTGKAPPESIAISADQATLTPVRALNPAVSPATEAVVVRAMRTQPTQRYPSIGEFKQALMGRRGVKKEDGKRAGSTFTWKRLVLLVGGLGTLMLAAGFCAVGRQLASWALGWWREPTPTTLARGDALYTAAASTVQAQLTQISVKSNPTPTIIISTSMPAIAPTPFADGFMACLSRCEDDGSNTVGSFSGGTKKLHLRWAYGNIPIGAHYVRYWTMNGREWVRYDCTWPGPASGVDKITLTEPDGLHSGTWEVTIMVDDRVILREQVIVEGNWSYWSPAGVFYTCYGKK